MIAVTFAVKAESRGLLRLLENRTRTTYRDIATISGRLHGESVTVLHTGVGATVCRERIQQFLAEGDFRYLISSGFAGGTDDRLRVGDLLIAENFSDQHFLAQVKSLPIKNTVHVGRLISADCVIESASERLAFSKSNGAIAVDMETEIIANACTARGLPMLSIRAISDTANEPFPAPPAVLFDLARQKTNPQRLALYLTKNPGRIVALVRFAKQIAKARANLTEALNALLRHPLTPKSPDLPNE